TRGGHDPHGIHDQPLHVEHPQLPRPQRRGVRRHRVAQGRAGLLHRQRRQQQALSPAHPAAQLLQPAGAAAADEGLHGGRRRRRYRLHRHRARRGRPMSGRGPVASLVWADSYDIAEVDEIVERNKWRRGAALEILEDIQEHYGWISPAAIQRVAELTDYSRNYLYGVVTFYDEFRIAPPGTVKVDICNGSACALNREDRILHKLEDLLQLEEITDSSPHELFTQNKFGYVSDDGKVLLRKVDCMGACQLAPLVRVMKE